MQKKIATIHTQYLIMVLKSNKYNSVELYWRRNVKKKEFYFSGLNVEIMG